MLSLRLLGPVSLLPDGSTVAAGAAQRHRLALIALLAREPRLSASRDRLIALLWPEAPEPRARHLLRQALHVLRREVHPQLIAGEGDMLRLNDDVIDIDTLRFERALAARDFAAAAAAYAGAFMQGFHLPDSTEFEDWLHGQRVSLADGYASALEALARAAEQRQAHRDAVGWWRRLAEQEPGSSAVTVALMEALERGGDRSGALQTARIHEAHLRDEFGVAPDAAVSQLSMRLAQASAAVVPAGSDVAASAPPMDASQADGTPSQASDAALADGAPPASGGAVREEPALPGSGASARESQWPQPRRVRTFATAALLVALLLGVGLAARQFARPAHAPPPRVLVEPFENRTGDPTMEATGRLAADWIATTLSRSGLIGVVDPLTAYVAGGRSGNGAAPDSDGIALARALRADLIVRGAFYSDAEGVLVQAQITDAHGGGVLASIGPLRPATGEALALIAELERRVLGALAALLDVRLERLRVAAAGPPTYDAYHEYTLGLDPFVRHDYAAAIPHFSRAAALDTTFLLPVFWSAFAARNLGRNAAADSLIAFLSGRRDRLPPPDRHGFDYLDAARRGDGAAALAAVRQASALAPGSHWSFLHALTAYRLDHPAEAIRALATVDPGRGGWIGDWNGYWIVLTDALHRAQQHQRELDAARRARIGHEQDPALLALELRALAALGRTREVGAAISGLHDVPPERSPGGAVTIALELRAHGHGAAADSVLSQYLRYHARMLDARAASRWRHEFAAAIALARLGRHEQARTYFDRLAAEQPASTPYQGWRGVTAALTGDGSTARAVAYALEEEENPLALLFRARIAAALGEHDRAAAIIEHTLRSTPTMGPSFPLVWHYEPDVSFLRDSLRIGILRRPTR
jgi:DNA-binding SARP family transcriptional activator/TolB-like protein